MPVSSPRLRRSVAKLSSSRLTHYSMTAAGIDVFSIENTIHATLDLNVRVGPWLRLSSSLPVFLRIKHKPLDLRFRIFEVD